MQHRAIHTASGDMASPFAKQTQDQLRSKQTKRKRHDLPRSSRDSFQRKLRMRACMPCGVHTLPARFYNCLMQRAIFSSLERKSARFEYKARTE